MCKHPYLCSTGFRLVGRSRKEIKRALDLVGIDAIPVLLRVANYESEVLMVRIRRPLDDAAEAVRRLQRQNRATRLENHNTVDEMAALDPHHDPRARTSGHDGWDVISSDVHDSKATPYPQPGVDPIWWTVSLRSFLTSFLH